MSIQPQTLSTALRTLLTAVAVALFASCSKGPAPEAVPAGSPMLTAIHFQFAIYYLSQPSTDPSAQLSLILSREPAGPKQVDELQEMPGEPQIRVSIHTNVQEKYAPPDMGSLQYDGHGLSREQAESLQDSEQALVMDFGHPREDVWEGLRTANRIAEQLARETGGLLWDEETRGVFTPDEWHKRRVASWVGRAPDASTQITIHAYQSDEYVRAITLGMAKFGLPDVVVEEFSWSMNRTMGHLINLFCQAMVEGAEFEKAGEFDLDLNQIQNRHVRDLQVRSLKANATAVAPLGLRRGEPDKGDPPNRLIEITFDRCPGRDVHARQEQMLSGFFGWQQAIAEVKHDEELLAASEEARARLPALYEAFSKGLHPGEFIQVKAPFKTPDGGQEWMWVEITAWEENRIKGLLKNEPYNIPSLHGGQIVDVKQEEIFDYVRQYPDGRQEGNRTGRIIQKMQQEKGRE